MTTAPLDLCVLWEWSYDDDFVDRLRRQCARRGKTFADYRDERVPDFFRRAGAAPVRLIVDRVSDEQPQIIEPLGRLKRKGALLINDPEPMARCRDKAVLHGELLKAGVRVPYSVILSTGEHPESVDVLELVNGRLGDPFVIKPAEGGGGTNVKLDAHDRKDIRDYLARTGEGKIVLQRKVLPRRFGVNRAWFRMFWALGRTIPCWWDDLTHIYRPVSDEEEQAYNLQRLTAITALLAKVSGLRLFSTEIAVDEDDECVVVDAINDMPDFRLQSRHPDGVSDAVVDRIVEILTAGAPVD